MIWLCLLLVAVSFLISAPLVWALAGLGRRVGHVDEPGTEAHKAHARAVPSTGGLGIFFAIAAPMFAINGAIWLMPQQAYSGWLEPLAAHVPGLMQHANLGIAILIAMVVVHITGLIDDRRGLSAWTKLTVQGAVAVVLVIFFDMRIFQSLAAHGGAGMVACIAISIVWLVVITNAMNFLDNMDGLSAGVGVVVAGLYLAATLIAGQWFVAALCALLVGALLGFLVFNFPSAKVFMGDAGSLVIGLLIAVISVRTTYFEADALLDPPHWYGVLMPLLLLAVPLYDFTSVTLMRILAGKSPMSADRNHLSHRLVRRGLSPRAAVIVIWLCTLVVGLGGVMLAKLRPWQACLVAAQALAVLIVLAMLERVGFDRDES